MKKITENIIEYNLSDEIVAKFYSANYGEKLGLYIEDDKLIFSVGTDVGKEICPQEMPIADIKCPGIGNVYMPFFEDESIEEKLDDVEKIWKTCTEGDIIELKEEIAERLYQDYIETVLSEA